MTGYNRRCESEIDEYDGKIRRLIIYSLRNIFFNLENYLKRMSVIDYNAECESEPFQLENIDIDRSAQILVHVIMELPDKPWELLKGLKIFKVIKLAIVYY